MPNLDDLENTISITRDLLENKSSDDVKKFKGLFLLEQDFSNYKDA